LYVSEYPPYLFTLKTAPNRNREKEKKRERKKINHRKTPIRTFSFIFLTTRFCIPFLPPPSSTENHKPNQENRRKKEKEKKIPESEAEIGKNMGEKQPGNNKRKRRRPPGQALE
jgi:hypothetical protein